MTDPEAAPKTAQKPDRSISDDDSPERFIKSLRPATFRAHPLASLACFLILIAGLGLLIYNLMGHAPASAGWFAGIAAILAFVGIAWLWILSRFAKLRVTNKRTILSRGLFSRATSEVVHDNIRNFQIDQSFYDRIVNIGTIGISSSGQDDVEITCRHVPAPDTLRDLIDTFRKL